MNEKIRELFVKKLGLITFTGLRSPEPSAPAKPPG